MFGYRQSFYEALSNAAAGLKVWRPALLPRARAVHTGTAAIVRAYGRPFGIGVSVGCAVALLHLVTRNSDPEPLPALAAAAPLGEPLAGNFLPEVALSEIVIRASRDGWRPAENPAENPADNRAPSIELETRDVMVSGRAVAAVIVLKRTGSASGRARVRCKTIPGTATPAKDYESLSTVVQFGDRQTMRTIFVPILQQSEESGSRTFSVMLERAPRGPSLGAITSTTVTILGDS